MTTTELTKKDILIESLSGLDFNSEASHFSDLRKNAIAEIDGLDFPTTKTEYWKYTRIGKIINKEYTINSDAQAKIEAYLIPNLEANTIVLINGFFNEVLSNIDEQEGIQVLSLKEGKDKGIVIKDHFNKYSTDRGEIFMAINNAYHTDGVCIHIDKNIVANKPYHILNLTTGSSIISLSRNLFLGEMNSDIKIIESFINTDGSDNFINHVSEIFVDENAHLEYNKIQDEINANTIVTTDQVYQKSNSTFTINTSTFNGALVRNNLNIEVDGTNCETNLNGLYLIKNKDHVDNHTVVDHKRPHCNSNEVYKGILDDESVGVFNGKVFVRQDAQITNAFQKNNTILLSDNAVANSKPELEIYADDVKCSHGSTTGQIDEEAIFYLRSRGVSRKGAINLMINAFAKETLENISIEAVRAYIENNIEERLS